ncbi:hypothetical protein L6452_28717 [Arctium lappa]|uniref:Uncharacterized protein n=1 Tax=Arctium lappa TaxID=4217 RepID=A0ACB9A0J9_ARCLA|nr:hypothetical protein L6452_28717 [Arctium lappa]
MASNGYDPQMGNSTEVKREPSEDDDSFDSDDGLVFTWIGGSKAADNVFVSLKAETIKEKLLEFADNAAEELYEMAYSGSPLWILDDLGEERLDREIYRNRFTPSIEHREELVVEILRGALDDPREIPSLMKPPTKPKIVEASWATETVLMNPVELVHMFMDVEQWLAMFSNIVSSATVLGKILEDDQNPDGSLIAMKAEFGLPTPNPTKRETYFLRRSKKVNDHVWLIVDASLDITCLKYHRKPSGCLIEQMDDGFSRVTWVEHSERSNGYLHELFVKQISSDFAFCASRWITTLKHEAENQFVINQHINAQGGGMSSLLRLAHRMSQRCVKNMNVKKNWNLIHSMDNAEPVYVIWHYFENNLGTPDGHVITMASSVRSFLSVDHLYDALRCADFHPKWDLAVAGGFARKDLHVPMGNDPTTGVSVLNIEVPGMEPRKCLKACFTDSIGMYVVWTLLDITTFYAMIEGGDPDAVPILVCGAAILPWDPIAVSEGSILTFSFEIQDEYEGSLSVEREESLNSLMTNTVSSVNALCTQLPGDEGYCHDGEEYLRLFDDHK